MSDNDLVFDAVIFVSSAMAGSTVDRQHPAPKRTAMFRGAIPALAVSAIGVFSGSWLTSPYTPFWLTLGLTAFMTLAGALSAVWGFTAIRDTGLASGTGPRASIKRAALTALFFGAFPATFFAALFGLIQLAEWTWAATGLPGRWGRNLLGALFALYVTISILAPVFWKSSDAYVWRYIAIMAAIVVILFEVVIPYAFGL